MFDMPVARFTGDSGAAASRPDAYEDDVVSLFRENEPKSDVLALEILKARGEVAREQNKRPWSKATNNNFERARTNGTFGTRGLYSDRSFVSTLFLAEKSSLLCSNLPLRVFAHKTFL